LPASPHLAAQNEDIEISLEKIYSSYCQLLTAGRQLVIEGAGGLLVPLNEKEFVTDLIKRLNAKVILVSQNYLGSINHSLLTAHVCRQKNIRVLGWVFNDQYMNYEDDIVRWSGYPKLGSVSKLDIVDKEAIRAEAEKIKEIFYSFYNKSMLKNEARKIFREKRDALSSAEREKLNDLLLIQFQKVDLPFLHTVCPIALLKKIKNLNTQSYHRVS
jgi:hypothetical protein